MATDKTERLAIHTGGCQCGAVRFATYIEPPKIGLCHCRMCQKAVAGPFAALAEVPWGEFAWTRGQPAAFQSSSRSIRDFCATCGTPLSYRKPGGKIIALYVHRRERHSTSLEPTKTSLYQKFTKDCHYALRK